MTNSQHGKISWHLIPTRVASADSLDLSMSESVWIQSRYFLNQHKILSGDNFFFDVNIGWSESRSMSGLEYIKGMFSYQPKLLADQYIKKRRENSQQNSDCL